MRLALTLRAKVLLLALANVLLVGTLLAWFATTQLTQSVGSLLLGESRGRIGAVAVEIGRELPRLAPAERDAMLARYSQRHGVTFRLVHMSGTLVGGPPTALPEEVLLDVARVRSKTPLMDRAENTARIVRGGGVVQADESFALENPAVERLLAVALDPPFLEHVDGTYWVLVRMPLRARGDPLFQPGMLIMSSPSFFGTPFFFDLKPWLLLGAALLGIVLVCWLPPLRGATRAIAGLASATKRIAGGDFAAKVEVRRADELGQLGESLNRMAAQLEDHAQGQKRFLRDAAHELHSPLARMQGVLGNLTESPVAAEIAPLIEDLEEEIELMTALTRELVAYARDEGAKGSVRLAPVSLPEIAERVVATENPSRAADIRVQLEDAAAVSAHEGSLFRGLSNIVRNAIRYAGDRGPITLSAESRGASTVLTVRDHGPGVPEEALEAIFLPFFRLDDSRDRKTGGHGLGMAIARSCFEACKGTIRCRNRNPGLEVIITLQSA